MRKIGGLSVFLGITVVLILSCSNSSDNIGNSTTEDATAQPNNSCDSPDTIGPYVIYAYPGGEGTLEGCETEWGTPVLVAFSEPIKDASVSPNTFNVGFGKEGRIEVCGNTIVYRPKLAFDNLVLIQVTVSGEICDTVGNSMGDDYVFTFYTRGEP